MFHHPQGFGYPPNPYYPPHGHAPMQQQQQPQQQQQSQQQQSQQQQSQHQGSVAGSASSSVTPADQHDHGGASSAGAPSSPSGAGGSRHRSPFARARSPYVPRTNPAEPPSGNNNWRGQQEYSNTSDAPSPLHYDGSTVPSAPISSVSGGGGSLYPGHSSAGGGATTPRGYAGSVSGGDDASSRGHDELTHQKYEWALRHLDAKDAELSALRRKLANLEPVKEQYDRAISQLSAASAPQIQPADLSEGISRVLEQVQALQDQARGLQQGSGGAMIGTGTGTVDGSALQSLEMELQILRQEHSEAMHVITSALPPSDPARKTGSMYQRALRLAEITAASGGGGAMDTRASPSSGSSSSPGGETPPNVKKLRDQLEQQVAISERLQAKVQELTASSRDRSDLMEKYRAGMSVEQGRLQARVRDLERQLQAKGGRGGSGGSRDAEGAEAKQQLAKLEEKYRSAMRSLSRTTDEVAALQRRCAELETSAEEHEQCVAELASAGVPGAPELLVRLSQGITSATTATGSSSSSSAGNSPGDSKSSSPAASASRGSSSSKRDTRTLRDILRYLVSDHEAAMAALAEGISSPSLASSLPPAGTPHRRAIDAAAGGRVFSVRLGELAGARVAQLAAAVEAAREEAESLRREAGECDEVIAEGGKTAGVRIRGKTLAERAREVLEGMAGKAASSSAKTDTVLGNTQLQRDLSDKAELAARLQHEQRQCVSLLNVYMPASLRGKDVGATSLVDILKAFLRESEAAGASAKAPRTPAAGGHPGATIRTGGGGGGKPNATPTPATGTSSGNSSSDAHGSDSGSGSSKGNGNGGGAGGAGSSSRASGPGNRRRMRSSEYKEREGGNGGTSSPTEGDGSVRPGQHLHREKAVAPVDAPEAAEMAAAQAEAAESVVPSAEEQMKLNALGGPRAVGDAFLSKYKLGHQLGYGTFSTVNMCVGLDGAQEFAVKIVAKKQQNGRFMRSFQREVEILKIVNHKYILRLHEIVETADTLYIVTDLLRGGDVLNRLEMHGRYSEHDARIVTKKVLEATAYLHSQGIIHRDLKPENILLARQDSGTDIKLCDFGHSALGNDDKDGFGTYSYLAPEVITNQKGTTAVDLWSIGVILYVLLSGTFPFDSSDDQRMFAEIVHGRYAFPDSHWRTVSAAAKDLIRCLMCIDPAKRHTVAQALRHPWLVGVNV